ncbi:hypothetical protein LP414_07860 [Polaromonas sp. P1(28)-13]|nr:hypothetical protein LP414_07860 [Polaromonas sp. P1(28)-13]
MFQKIGKAIVLVVGAMAVATSAGTAEKYPSQPIRIISPSEFAHFLSNDFAGQRDRVKAINVTLD